MRSTVLAVALVAGSWGAAVIGAADDTPGARLPVVKDRRYVMSGAVRPLLFWITREDIGVARIVWRSGSDGARGYELLVGTEPSRAPGGINRWGFVSEEALGSDGSVLALMTGSQQTSFDDEAAAATARGGDFQAVRARVESGTARWRLSRVRTAERLTVHDLAQAVESVDAGGGTLAQQRQVTPATRPGFLVAVADLLDMALQPAALSTGRPALAATRVRYVFGEQIYELRVRSAEPASLTFKDARVPVIQTSFESRSLTTGARSHFLVAAGTSGDLLGVPLEIRWQPRWWLRVRLTLAE